MRHVRPPLAISNLALAGVPPERAWPLIAEAGADGVEIAPTVVWPEWRDASSEAALGLASTLMEHGLACPAFQSIVYGRPELRLFGDDADRAVLFDHLVGVADLARRVGAFAMVFGAPRNRLRGTLDEAAADRIATDFLRRLGPELDRRGVQLTVEANPVAYGADYLTHLHDAASLVRRVGTPGIGLQLDTSEIILNDVDPAEAVPRVIDLVGHVHVSEPALSDFSEPSPRHAAIADALGSAGWSGWVSIEMGPVAEAEEAVARAIDFVRTTYGAGRRGG